MRRSASSSNSDEYEETKAMEISDSDSSVTEEEPRDSLVKQSAGVGGGHIGGTFLVIPTEHFGKPLQSTLRYRIWSTLKICAQKKSVRQSFFG